MNFKKQILLGIPDELPVKKGYDLSVNRAPVRESAVSYTHLRAHET